MAKILLTGGTGYIGSQLLKRLLSDGFEIAVVMRPGSDAKLINPIISQITPFTTQGDLNDLVGFMAAFKPDIVIHLASLFIAEHSPQQVDNLLNSNIVFGTHLLEAMSLAGVNKIINTGTSWQNYNNENYNPVCLYAATKQAFEDILLNYVETKRINAVTLIIYDTFGPGDPRNKIINLFNKIAKSGEYLEMSKGEQELDLIYIDDIVDAYVQAIDLLLNNPSANNFSKYYLHSDQPLKLKDIADIYSSIMNVKLNIKWGARPYRSREVMKTYRQGKLLPGWKPRLSVRDGLLRMKSFSQDLNPEAKQSEK